MADREDRKAEAALQGFGQGASFSFLDELAGLAAATNTNIPALLTLMEGGNPFSSDPEDMRLFAENYEKVTGLPVEEMLTKKGYQRARDESRRENKSLREQHPVTYGLSELAGGISTPIPGAAPAKGASLGAKLGKGALVGAGIGATSGIGSSESKTLQGDIENARLGSMFGAGAGAGGAYAGDKLSKLLGMRLAKNQPKLVGVEDPRLAELAAEQRGVIQPDDWWRGVSQAEMESRILNAGDAIAEDLAQQRRAVSAMAAPTQESRAAVNKLIADQMTKSKKSSGLSNAQFDDVAEGVTREIDSLDPHTKKILREYNELLHNPEAYAGMGKDVSQSQSTKDIFEELFKGLPAGQRFSKGAQERMSEELANRAAAGDQQARALRMSLDEGLTETGLKSSREALGPTSQHVFMDKQMGPAAKSAIALWGPKSPRYDPEKVAQSTERLSKAYNMWPNAILNELERGMGQNMSDIRSLDTASRATRGMPRGAALEREALLFGQSIGENLPQFRSREVSQLRRMLDLLGLSEDEE